jgi:hypothetical protein
MTSKLESILFDEKLWTTGKVKTWLKSHGYKTTKALVVSDRYIHARVMSLSGLTRAGYTHFRVKELGKGIKATFAFKNGSKNRSRSKSRSRKSRAR